MRNTADTQKATHGWLSANEILGMQCVCGIKRVEDSVQEGQSAAQYSATSLMDSPLNMHVLSRQETSSPDTFHWVLDLSGR